MARMTVQMTRGLKHCVNQVSLSLTSRTTYQINTVQCNVLNVRITVTNIFILPNSGLSKIRLDVAFFKKELAHVELNLPCPGPALDNFCSPVIIH